jgi:hypothetical protein
MYMFPNEADDCSSLNAWGKKIREFEFIIILLNKYSSSNMYVGPNIDQPTYSVTLERHGVTLSLNTRSWQLSLSPKRDRCPLWLDVNCDRISFCVFSALKPVREQLVFHSRENVYQLVSVWEVCYTSLILVRRVQRFLSWKMSQSYLQITLYGHRLLQDCGSVVPPVKVVNENQILTRKCTPKQRK